MKLLPSHQAAASPILTFFASTLFAASVAAQLSNGLQIEVTTPKECHRSTRSGDKVLMHYTGTLESGKEFDSSLGRGRPFSFVLGAGRVIKGWDLGLLNMCLGEERMLTIPPALGYGDREYGPIPAGSTLIFYTKLVGIVGVSAEEAASTDPPPPVEDDMSEGQHTQSSTSTSFTPSSTFAAPATSIAETQSEPSTITQSTGETKEEVTQKEEKEDNGECSLLGPFALFVQGGLGLLALVSLVWKRWRERPQRPLKVWFFDASKQVFGSALLHVFNVLMSMLSAGEYEMAQTVKQASAQAAAAAGDQANPCSFYLINIAVDTTVGIPILVVILKVLQHAAGLTPLARPAESIKSGHYGQPPKTWWWFKQSMIYFVALLLMKLCVYFIFAILPWIVTVGNWALRWTQGSEALQITFSMLIFPLIMNALQYYIIDSFIKEPGAGESDGRQAEDDDDEDAESRQRLHEPDEDEEERVYGAPRDVQDTKDGEGGGSTFGGRTASHGEEQQGLLSPSSASSSSGAKGREGGAKSKSS